MSLVSLFVCVKSSQAGWMHVFIDCLARLLGIMNLEGVDTWFGTLVPDPSAR